MKDEIPGEVEKLKKLKDIALEARLNAEEANHGAGVSILVVNVLNKYHRLVGSNTKTKAQLAIDVLKKSQNMLLTLQILVRNLTLMKASTTYTQIEMAYDGKPKVVKTRIVRIFAKEIGLTGRFAKVELKW